MSYQPERIREPNPDAEDEAHDADVQRKLDDERAAEMVAKRNGSGVSLEELFAQQPPKRVPCHNCEQPHAAIICPFCREPRPAYLALKKATA